MRRRLLALGLAIALLAGLEGLLRAVVPPEQLLFSYERPNSVLMLDSEKMTYLPRPLAQDVIPDGPNHWRYRMNAAGLREDKEIPRERPAGTVRYLALGDSWIWSQSADQSTTLDVQLETILSSTLGKPVEVLNAGVPGGGAYDMLVRWRMLRDRWQVDGLVLGAPKNIGRQKAVGPERAVWLGGGAPYFNSYLYLGLRRLLIPLTRSRLRDFDDATWGTALEDTVMLVKEARAAGLDVVLGMWPATRDEARSGKPVVPYAAFSQALTPLGARVTGAKLASSACWGFEDHSHPSESGYRALAEMLADRMTTGADPGALRSEPRCEDVPGSGPTKSAPPRSRAQADAGRVR